MQTQIAMGFCPNSFSATRPFQFVSARAIYASAETLWLQLGNPTTQFPPSGTFYVSHDLIPESFEGPGGSIAAWILDDQPDWQESHLGARFRARSLSPPPAEIIPVAISSTEIEAIRRLLLEDGISFSAGLAGRPILIEFADGVLGGPFELYGHESNPNSYVCNSAALLNPVRTWQAQGEGTVLRFVLSWSDQKRVFARNDPLPQAQGDLFLAPLDELLRRANLAGGVSSQRRVPSADVARHIRSLEQVLAELPSSQISEAILQRIQPLIDRTELTHSAQIALDEYVARHPLFDQAIQKKANEQIENLREDIRREVLGQQTQVLDEIEKLKQQHDQAKQLLAQELQVDQQRAKTRRQEIEEDLVRLQKEKEDLARSVDELRREANSYCSWKTSVGQSARVLTSPNEALEHLSKNLGRLGLLPASAQNMAREAFASACLGQMLMFRGSFALPMARVIAQSLAGNCVHYLSVPVGLIIPIPQPQQNSTEGNSVFLIEGLNRSCFDSYSGELAVMLEERCLGLRASPNPIVIGTLLDAPSSVPPSPALLSCGPVFSTDHLSWKANLQAQRPDPGSCVASAWKIQPRAFSATNLIPEKCALSVRGRRNIAAAGALLAALASSTKKEEVEEELDASLLFGWIYPSLANGDGDYSELAKECRTRWQSASEQDSQRLGRLLCMGNVKEKS
jgi:hypothetical protein